MINLFITYTTMACDTKRVYIWFLFYYSCFLNCDFVSLCSFYTTLDLDVSVSINFCFDYTLMISYYLISNNFCFDCVVCITFCNSLRRMLSFPEVASYRDLDTLKSCSKFAGGFWNAHLRMLSRDACKAILVYLQGSLAKKWECQRI